MRIIGAGFIEVDFLDDDGETVYKTETINMNSIARVEDLDVGRVRLSFNDGSNIIVTGSRELFAGIAARMKQ